MPTDKPASRWTFFQRLADNPVIAKELRGRMRGRRAFVLLTAYLCLISLFITIVYLTMTSNNSFAYSNPGFRQSMGKAIFGTVVLMELLLVSFIAPGLTSGAISSERERQTLDLLRTSLLSARSLVLGKLGVACVYLFLLIFAALPIESLGFFLGGVGIAEIIISTLLLIVTAVSFCALGLFFSSFMKRTLTATVSSYASILLSLLMLVVFFFLGLYIDMSGHSDILEDFLLILLWLLISTNPLLTAIVTEIILIEDQSLLYTSSSPFGSASFNLPSPWIIYVIIYLIVTVVMINLSTRFVARPDR